MIKGVSVINYLQDRLDIILTDPELTRINNADAPGLYIKSITGIGPSKANVNVTSLASYDGGIFNSARNEVRNITLNIGFYERQSEGYHNIIEDSRQLTYRMFPNKRPLTIIFETDNRYLYANGYVESNEPDIFNKEEACTISIICPDPNLYNADNMKFIEFGAIDNEFEFPGSNEFPSGADPSFPPSTGYCNDSLVEDLTIFGTINHAAFRTIVYKGEEDTGLFISINVEDTVSDIIITDVSTDEHIRIDDTKIAQIVGSGISSGDKIEINTTKGNKSAILTRSGIKYNIINALGRDPGWFQLHNGENVFTFTATNDLAVRIFMYYYIAYSGV